MVTRPRKWPPPPDEKPVEYPKPIEDFSFRSMEVLRMRIVDPERYYWVGTGLLYDEQLVCGECGARITSEARHVYLLVNRDMNVVSSVVCECCASVMKHPFHIPGWDLI